MDILVPVLIVEYVFVISYFLKLRKIVRAKRVQNKLESYTDPLKLFYGICLGILVLSILFLFSVVGAIALPYLLLIYMQILTFGLLVYHGVQYAKKKSKKAMKKEHLSRIKWLVVHYFAAMLALAWLFVYALRN